ASSSSPPGYSPSAPPSPSAARPSRQRKPGRSREHLHTTSSLLASRGGRSARRRDDYRPHMGGHEQRGRCVCRGDERDQCRWHRGSSDRPRREASTAAGLAVATLLPFQSGRLPSLCLSSRLSKRLLSRSHLPPRCA